MTGEELDTGIGHKDESNVHINEFSDGGVHVSTCDAAKTRYIYEFEPDDDGGLELKKRAYKADRIPDWGPKTPIEVTPTVRDALESEGYHIVEDSDAE